MPLPTVVVAGTIDQPDTVALTGATIDFSTLAEMVDAAGNVLVPRITVVATVVGGQIKAADGTSVLTLYASDTGATTVPYMIRENFGRKRRWAQNLTTSMVVAGHIPYAALGPVSPAPSATAPYALLADLQAEESTREAADATLTTDLAGKAAAVHTHVESDVTALTTDLAGKVPSTRLVNGHALSGDVTVTATDVGAAATVHSHAETDVTSLTSNLAAKADLVAGVIPTSQLPALAINDTFPVASQAAMLALTAQRGDVAIRSDLGKSFILSADDPTVLANWIELPATGKVTSVNGQQGVIVLAATDVGADPSGAAAAVLATSAQKAANLSDLASATTARTNLGLGSASTHAATDFDTAGAAAAAQAAAATDAAAKVAAQHTADNGTYVAQTSQGVAGGVATLDTVTALVPITQRRSQKRLHGFYVALADRFANPCDIVVVGDSIGEGQAASTINTRWVNRFLDLLRSRLPVPGVTGGFGFIPSWYNLSSPTGISPTVAGTTSHNSTFGLGRRSTNLAPTGSSITFTLPTCSSFDLCMRRTSNDQFSVAIDGGAPVTIGVATSGEGTWNSGALAVATHSVVVTQVANTPQVEGIMVYNGDETKGIRLWGGSKFGSSAATFETGSSWQDALVRTNPDLVIVALGTNDCLTVTSAAFQTSLTNVLANIRSKAPNTSVLFLGYYERVQGVLLEPWANYVTAMKNVAYSDSAAAMLDLTDMIPRLSPDTYTVLNADLIHPVDRGHSLLADIPANYLLAGA